MVAVSGARGTEHIRTIKGTAASTGVGGMGNRTGQTIFCSNNQ